MDAGSKFEATERRVMEYYGLKYESRFVALSEPRMRARIIEVGAGEPVLLVHGGLGYASLWAPLMAALPGYRLLAVDRPGYGLSDAFVHRRGQLRRDAVSFLESVLDALGLSAVHVIASSMGGLWTFWLALDRPQRVRAISQVGCPALVLGTSAPVPMRLLSVRRLNRLMTRIGPRQTGRTVLRQLGDGAAADIVPPAFLECMEAAAELPTWWPASLSLLEAALRLRGARVPLSEGELGRIAQPTLFVWGTRDPFGDSRIGRRVAATMSDARFIVLEAGHVPMVGQPAAVASPILDHLRRTGVERATVGQPQVLSAP